MAFPKRFGKYSKGPLGRAGVQKGWLPKIGFLRTLFDVILVYMSASKNIVANLLIDLFNYSPR